MTKMTVEYMGGPWDGRREQIPIGTRVVQAPIYPEPLPPIGSAPEAIDPQLIYKIGEYRKTGDSHLDDSFISRPVRFYWKGELP